MSISTWHLIISLRSVLKRHREWHPLGSHLVVFHRHGASVGARAGAWLHGFPQQRAWRSAREVGAVLAPRSCRSSTQEPVMPGPEGWGEMHQITLWFVGRAANREDI